MATRSTIAFENEDGTIDQIYCHWDGGLWHVGPTLFEHYREPEKIKQLIQLGDISSLAPEIGEKQDFNGPNEGWTVAYGRDRGETDIEAKTFADFEHYEQNHQYQEYEYLFTKDGIWNVFFNDDWHDLELELQIYNENQEN